MIETYDVQCPYCGEKHQAVIVLSVEEQEYVEDCEVCCRPIVFTVNVDLRAGLSVEVRREDG